MWDFAKSVLAGVIGAVATLGVGLLGYWNTDRSHDIEMVRISLSILGGENEDTSLNGRRFALRALSKYADVEIPEDEFNEWAATGTIPELTSFDAGFALDLQQAYSQKLGTLGLWFDLRASLRQRLLEAGLSEEEVEEIVREELAPLTRGDDAGSGWLMAPAETP